MNSKLENHVKEPQSWKQFWAFWIISPFIRFCSYILTQTPWTFWSMLSSTQVLEKTPLESDVRVLWDDRPLMYPPCERWTRPFTSSAPGPEKLPSRVEKPLRSAWQMRSWTPARALLTRTPSRRKTKSRELPSPTDSRQTSYCLKWRHIV